MRRSIVTSALFVGIALKFGGLAVLAETSCVQKDDSAFMVGVSGFSKAVCNEPGTASYEDYIRTFCELFPTMQEVSFDFYPYSAPPAEVESYLLRRLADFSIVARACREYNRRLAFCLQANSLFKELEMDLPRLRYQAFTALAFGTRRVVWECYTPSWWEAPGLEVSLMLSATSGWLARCRASCRLHGGRTSEGNSGV